MGRPEQRRPGARQGGEVLLAERAGGHLVDRLGHPVAQRSARHRAGQGGQRRAGLLADPGEAAGQRVVEAGDHVVGLGQSGRNLLAQLRQLSAQHQRSTGVDGNQCSSGSGVLPPGSSR